MEFTIYGQTLGVVTVEYDERILSENKWKAVKNKFVVIFNLGHGVSGSALRHMLIM